jgi:hypothetical protein
MKKRTAWIVAGLCLVPGLSVNTAGAAARMKAKIVDEASGQALAARVAVTDADGKFVEIAGEHPHVQVLGKRWCYVDGSFTVVIPDSGATIEIRRGLETLPLLETLKAGAAAKPVEKTFRLHRWIDLRQKGWLNGDIHAHLPVPKEAVGQMRAEDLNTLTLYHMADSQYKLATNECFTGKLDTHSIPGCEVYVGQEIREFQMGHLGFMGITHLVPGYPDMGGGLEYWRSQPHFDLTRAAQAVREQKGTVAWAHVCSVPGHELPIEIALGLVDVVELITWSDPTQLPNHYEPWENSGFSQAEFPLMRSLDLYYQVLNAGFRMPIAAGTDKFGEEISLGSNRAYAQVKDPAGYATWLEAVKAGRSFVTNGPILEFDADGQQAGDVVEFQGTRRVKVRVAARSILPFNTLEIVANGRLVGHKSVATQNNPPKDGLTSMEVTATVDLDQSTWLAGRVVDNPDLRNNIMPRGASVFAHTAPVYFLQEGRKVRDPAAIAYLTKYVQGTLHWLATHPKFTTEQEWKDAQSSAEQALKVYQGL